MNFVEARDNWKARDGWEFADKDVTWNYFFTAGMVASDEIHKPLAQQAADWYALYDRATKERNEARKELVRLRTLIADIKAWDVDQYINIPHVLRARMQAELLKLPQSDIEIAAQITAEEHDALICDAHRYRWLRQHGAGKLRDIVQPLAYLLRLEGTGNALKVSHAEIQAMLDEEIDNAMALTPNAELRGRPLADGPA